MSDFDTIKSILDKIYPNEELRPYIDYVQNDEFILEFGQEDEWYNTYFVFDQDGNLKGVN